MAHNGRRIYKVSLNTSDGDIIFQSPTRGKANLGGATLGAELDIRLLGEEFLSLLFKWEIGIPILTVSNNTVVTS